VGLVKPKKIKNEKKNESNRLSRTWIFIKYVQFGCVYQQMLYTQQIFLMVSAQVQRWHFSPQSIDMFDPRYCTLSRWNNWGYMVYIYVFDLKPFCYHYFKRYHHLIFIDHVKRDFRCLKLNQVFWVVNPSSG
jgi:hypothetical protein